MAPGGEAETEGSKYFGKTRVEVREMEQQNAFSQVVAPYKDYLFPRI